MKNLLLSAIALVCLSSAALANGDHDHGAPKQQAAGTASPRIALHTELFELVGIVEGGEMTIYLDRYADNTPVSNARIDIEAEAIKASATAQPDGTYRWKSDVLQKTGELALAFTVSAGGENDLLAGTLTIGAPPSADPHTHSITEQWRTWAIGAAGAILVLAVLVLALRAQRRAARTLGPAR